MLSTEIYDTYHVGTILTVISLFAMIGAVAIMLKISINNYFTSKHFLKLKDNKNTKVFKFNKPNIKTDEDTSFPKSIFPLSIDSEKEHIAMEQLMNDLGVDNAYFDDMIQYKGREACLIHWGWIYHKAFIMNENTDT